MTTDNPDTNSSPAESPSSRPMTLRQQLEAIRISVKWQDGKVIEFDSIGNDDVIDEILNLFERYGQEIAREAAQGASAHSATPTALDKQVATLHELYGRLHQTIELFQVGAISAEDYSTYHAELTDKISEVRADGTDLVAYGLDPTIGSSNPPKLLTQKPPQPLADMQSGTSPKADSNQVDTLLLLRQLPYGTNLYINDRDKWVVVLDKKIVPAKNKAKRTTYIDPRKFRSENLLAALIHAAAYAGIDLQPSDQEAKRRPSKAQDTTNLSEESETPKEKT